MLDDYTEVMRRSYKAALSSPDPSTQNGAIVLDWEGNTIGSGCNRFTHGMAPTPELLERPKKYAYIEHAERNAIFSVLYGGKTLPHTMVCPWAACADCARAIVQSGIVRLVRHEREGGRWSGSIEDGDRILRAGGVEIITIDGPLGGCDPILFNGESWTP